MALLAEFVAGETSEIGELWNQKSASRQQLFTDASCDVSAAGLSPEMNLVVTMA
jgi:hypothetical protein